MKTQTGSGSIEWNAVTEWQSRRIARALIEAVVEVSRDPGGAGAGYSEANGKFQVHVRITPDGQAAADRYIPVPSREAGEALIAEKLAKAV